MVFTQVAVILLFTAYCNMSADCAPNVNHFKVVACVDEDVKTVLASNLGQSRDGRSLFSCATSCNENDRCQHAIFRDATKSCFHVFYVSYYYLYKAWFAEEAGCFVLSKERDFTCYNDGVPGSFVCECLGSFTGRECRQPTPSYCQSGQWRDVAPSESQMLAESLTKMKVTNPTSESVTVHHLQSFIMYASNSKINFVTDQFLAQNVLEETFQIPLAMEFLKYRATNEKLSTILVNINTEDVTSTNVQEPTLSLMIQDILDNDRLFYKINHFGNLSHLVDGLSKGYRLLSRKSSRVGFDATDVFVDDSYISTSDSDLDTPTYYYVINHVLASGSTFGVNRNVATGVHLSAEISETTPPKRWDLDRCWSHLAPTPRHYEFTGVLQETISQGREIRLVMDGTVSTDVSFVTLTDTDVVATLAEYYTPFDQIDWSNMWSRVVFSHVSRSGILAECEMELQTNKVYDQRTKQSTTGLEWYASSRPTTKVLIVGSEGADDFWGLTIDVVNAARTGRDIRVCVELGADVLAFCSGTSVVTVTQDQHVTIQTPGTLTNAFRKDGTFAGISGSDCEQNVWLVSTKGWVKTVAYRLGLGVTALEDDTNFVDFTYITWYVQ